MGFPRTYILDLQDPHCGLLRTVSPMSDELEGSKSALPGCDVEIARRLVEPRQNETRTRANMSPNLVVGNSGRSNRTRSKQRRRIQGRHRSVCQERERSLKDNGVANCFKKTSNSASALSEDR